MTDQQHADAIRAAVHVLNRAIGAATKAGLETRLTVHDITFTDGVAEPRIVAGVLRPISPTHHAKNAGKIEVGKTYNATTDGAPPAPLLRARMEEIGAVNLVRHEDQVIARLADTVVIRKPRQEWPVAAMRPTEEEAIRAIWEAVSAPGVVLDVDTAEGWRYRRWDEQNAAWVAAEQ